MVYTSLRLPMIQGILQYSAPYSAHYTAPYITECVLVSSLSQGVIGSSALPVQTDGAQVSQLSHKPYLWSFLSAWRKDLHYIYIPGE